MEVCNSSRGANFTRMLIGYILYQKHIISRTILLSDTGSALSRRKREVEVNAKGCVLEFEAGVRKKCVARIRISRLSSVSKASRTIEIASDSRSTRLRDMYKVICAVRYPVDYNCYRVENFITTVYRLALIST